MKVWGPRLAISVRPGGGVWLSAPEWGALWKALCHRERRGRTLEAMASYETMYVCTNGRYGDILKIVMRREPEEKRCIRQIYAQKTGEGGTRRRERRADDGVVSGDGVVGSCHSHRSVLVAVFAVCGGALWRCADSGQVALRRLSSRTCPTMSSSTNSSRP
jgi:hypothetical protein